MKPSVELVNLTHKSLSKTITRIEMARLEELLEDDFNLDYYLQLTSVEAHLPHLSPLEPLPLSATPRAQAPRWPRYAAAAAIIFLAGLLSGRLLFPSADRPDQKSAAAPASRTAASITSMIGVTWNGEAPESIDLTKESREISIDSGLVEITFQSGVRTLIEGPARFKVTGNNEAYMDIGRVVADVPDGAEGFTINYQEGKIIDLGTEFALHIPGNQQPVEVGVFRGEVEVYTRGGTPPMKVLENHAIKYGGSEGRHFSSIPFDRKGYIRELPSREFPWSLPQSSTDEYSELVFDVSHLVWKSGEYMAIFKWMNGQDATIIKASELRRNGTVVSIDNHFGRTGTVRRTKDNTYSFHINERPSRQDTWTLHFHVMVDDRSDLKAGEFVPDSTGMLLFEDAQSLNAKEDAFLGTWEYRHNDDVHQRTFHPDHTATYRINGKKTGDFQNSTWSVTDGILTLVIPRSYNGKRQDIVELHRLRDEHELIFLNHRYRNGYRVK